MRMTQYRKLTSKRRGKPEHNDDGVDGVDDDDDDDDDEEDDDECTCQAKASKGPLKR